MRSDTKTIRNGVRRRAAADSPAPNAELLSIPRLGEVRAKALAAAGVTSLDDLRNMPLDDLARIKWIGPGNAKLIKEWLEAHDSAATSTESTPAKRTRAPRTRAPRASEPAETSAPTGAPRRPRAPRPAASTALEPTPEAGAMIPISRGPVTIVESVEGYQTVTPSRRVDDAVARIKDAIPKKSREKKLGRQLKKVSQSVSDVPASLEAMRGSEKQVAFEALDRIAESINAAVESGKLSGKKQDALGAELKKLRKKLEKALGG